MKLMIGHLIILCVPLLILAACDRTMEQPQSARDSTRQAIPATAKNPEAFTGYRWDTLTSFDTVALKRLVLDHTKSDVTLDRWATGNLDEDPQKEILLVITTWGRDDSTTTSVPVMERPGYDQRLLVVDSSIGGWRIVDVDAVHGTAQEGPPEIGAFNPDIPSSAFYVEYYSARGSGTLFIHHRIFRIWKGKVYESNDLLARSGLQMCASTINQKAEGQVNQIVGDHFVVKYRYQFFLNGCIEESILDSSCGRDFQRDSEDDPRDLISERTTVTYNWDSASARFIPDYRGTRLSAAKMKCLMKLGPDEIFLAAYREEIEKLARISQSRCRRALAQFALDNL